MNQNIFMVKELRRIHYVYIFFTHKSIDILNVLHSFYIDKKIVSYFKAHVCSQAASKTPNFLGSIYQSVLGNMATVH